jgi:hypothetical protein
MKVPTLFSAIGLGCLLCGVYASDAQPRFYSMPIVVQLADVDRYHSYVRRDRRPVKDPTGYITILFNDLDKSKVHQMVVSHNWVCVMDGQKILVRCSLAGQAEYRDLDRNSKYGLLLRFGSTKEAEKAGAILKLEPDLKEADSKPEK